MIDLADASSLVATVARAAARCAAKFGFASLLALHAGLATAAPYAFFVTPGGKLLQFDTATNTIVGDIDIDGGFPGPYAAVVDPTGTRAYGSNFSANTVTVMDTLTRAAVATIALPATTGGPQAMAINPNGTRLYVVDCMTGSGIRIVDTATNMVIGSMGNGRFACDIVVNPSGTRLYASDGAVYNTANGNLVATIPLPLKSATVGMAIAPDGTRLYLRDIANQTVIVINTASNSVVTTIPLPTTFAANGVAVSNDGTRLFVANGVTLLVIDTATNGVVATVPMGTAAGAVNGLALTPDGTRAYAATASGIVAIDVAASTAAIVNPTSVRALGAFMGPAYPMYVFHEVSAPGAEFTWVLGMNDHGQVSGLLGVAGGGMDGFAYDPSAAAPWQTLPSLPNGLLPCGVWINNAGTLAGTGAPDPDCRDTQGFVIDGTAVSLVGGDAQHPYAHFWGIGASGIALGSRYARDANGKIAGGVALMYDAMTTVASTFSVPGHAYSTVEGINVSGESVGYATNPGVANSADAFLRAANGTLSPFRIHNRNTYAHSINDAGIIGGEVDVGGVVRGFVGTLGTWQLVTVPGSTYTAVQGINNRRDIIGQYNSSDGKTHSYYGTLAYPPVAMTAGGSFVFDVPVGGDPVVIDPPVAVGFVYAIGSGDPMIATTRLPIGIGDSVYTVAAGNQSFAVAGGELVDFRTRGFPQGVDGFAVTGIEVAAGLRPDDPRAFPTELGFVAPGRFTGTMTPIRSSLLSVQIRGSGGGSVQSSNVAGIACGGDCSESYAPDATVSLVATPFPGSVFTAWSGACAGTGPCAVPMSADATVTATFTFAGSAYAFDYVQRAYVAYYGRPADPVGQGYWAGQMDLAGGSLAAIIGAFGNSAEFTQRYGGLTHAQLITKVYQQALGRDPDPAGLAYYVDELQSGRRTLQSITLDVLNGATTPPDATVVANRLDVAAYYTAKVAAGCNYGTEQDAVAVLAAVTDVSATVAAAKAAIDARCGP